MTTLTLKGNPLKAFLFKSLLIYVVWYALYDLWLHPFTNIDLYVVKNIHWSAVNLLELIGYSVYTGADRLLGIDGSNGIWIGDNCNGISLAALFAGFIIAFIGKPLTKLFYILAGAIIIHLLNILRVIFVAILEIKSPSIVDLNHDFTFKVIIYAIIFCGWMVWVNKFSGINKPGNE